MIPYNFLWELQVNILKQFFLRYQSSYTFFGITIILWLYAYSVWYIIIDNYCAYNTLNFKYLKLNKITIIYSKLDS